MMRLSVTDIVSDQGNLSEIIPAHVQVLPQSHLHQVQKILLKGREEPTFRICIDMGKRSPKTDENILPN